MSAAPSGGATRRVGEPLIPRVMAQVAEAAQAFESRWTLAALKRVDADLHGLFGEQQDLCHESLITGGDPEVEEQAAAMCRGWAAIARAMELLKAAKGVFPDAEVINLSPNEPAQSDG